MEYCAVVSCALGPAAVFTAARTEERRAAFSEAAASDFCAWVDVDSIRRFRHLRLARDLDRGRSRRPGSRRWLRNRRGGKGCERQDEACSHGTILRPGEVRTH